MRKPVYWVLTLPLILFICMQVQGDETSQDVLKQHNLAAKGNQYVLDSETQWLKDLAAFRRTKATHDRTLTSLKRDEQQILQAKAFIANLTKEREEYIKRQSAKRLTQSEADRANAEVKRMNEQIESGKKEIAEREHALKEQKADLDNAFLEQAAALVSQLDEIKQTYVRLQENEEVMHAIATLNGETGRAMTLGPTRGVLMGEKFLEPVRKDVQEMLAFRQAQEKQKQQQQEAAANNPAPEKIPTTIEGPEQAVIPLIKKNDLYGLTLSINGKAEVTLPLQIQQKPCIVSAEVAEKAGITMIENAAKYKITFNNNAFDAGVGRADTIVIGPYTYKNMLVLVMPKEAGNVNQLGGDALIFFEYEIDKVNNTLNLKKK